MSNDANKPPLHGIKVLDFTQNLPGPYATFMLASWGAEVVKLEPPKGDPARSMEPFFSMVNRGKRSVVLDLRDPSQKATLEALIRWTDVLVEGFRPGVMTRLGCGFDEARAWNPHLVYCSISAFGQEGPLRDHPGHDLNLQAVSGVCALEADEKGIPRGSMLPVADLSSSMLAVASITAALIGERETRRAQHLDVAMADGVFSWANVWGRGIDLASGAERQLGDAPGVKALTRPLIEYLRRRKLYAMPHYGVFETSDGKHLTVGIVDEQHFWKALCGALELGPMAKLKLPVRTAAGPALRPLIARRLKARSLAAWMTRFTELGVPVSEVMSPDEAPETAAARARGQFDERGWMKSPLPSSISILEPAPTHGQHTGEILAMLGIQPHD